MSHLQLVIVSSSIDRKLETIDLKFLIKFSEQQVEI